MNYSRGKYLSYTLKRLTSNVTREKCTEFINLKIRTENSRARGTHTASLESKRLLFVIKRTPSLLSLPMLGLGFGWAAFAIVVLVCWRFSVRFSCYYVFS